MQIKGKRLLALMISVILLISNVLPVFAEDTIEQSDDEQGYTLMVDVSGTGTVKVTGEEVEEIEEDPEVYQIKAGSEVTVKVTPEDPYELAELRLNGKSVEETFQMPEEDALLEVKLEVAKDTVDEPDPEEEAGNTNQEERTPVYDLDALNKVFDSIDGMGTLNSGVATCASVGQSVYVSAIRTDIGSIEMIRYGSDGSWSSAGSWSE